MNFGDYLISLIDTYGLSKNKLIKDTGIDRSSFFQFLKGSRKPTGKQLSKIACAAGFKNEEKNLLHELYVKDKHGEETFRTWQMIREMIGKLDSMTFSAPKDTPIYRYMKDVCTANAKENGDPAASVHFDLFLSIRLFMDEDISNILASLPAMFPGTVSVRLIIVNFSDQEISDAELIEHFMYNIPLYMVPRLEFKVHYYPGMYQRTKLPLIGYPFFILSDHSLLLINDIDKSCKLLEDKDFQHQYSSNFETFIKQYPPLSKQGIGLQDYANALESMLQYSDENLVYTVEYRPCVLSIAPMDLVVKYVPAELQEIARPYVSIFQSTLHLKEYFTPEGFEDLRNDGIIYEAGPNVILTRPDTETICSLILDKMGKTRFFLNSSRFKASQMWSIASGRKALIFATNKEENISVFSLDPQICSAFYDYFSHLYEDGAEMLPLEAEARLITMSAGNKTNNIKPALDHIT